MDNNERANDFADENELTEQELDKLLHKFVESFPVPVNDEETLHRGLEDIKRRLRERKGKSGEPENDHNHSASS